MIDVNKLMTIISNDFNKNVDPNSCSILLSHVTTELANYSRAERIKEKH